MASRSSGFGRGRWARFALVAWACVTLLAVSATAGSGVDEATKRMQEFMRARQRQQRESLERMREWEKANLGGSGGGRAEITVLSEVPLTTATEMASSSSDASARRTSRSSTSSTRGGGSGSSTYTYSSSSSSSSSSFSRSSTRAAGEVKSSDRVGIAVQTPEVDIVFNVGPALENLGIRVTPRSEPAAVARGLEEEAFSVEPPAAEPGRPSRILIEDGADISQVGNGYPTLNIELETPLFNFTYVESEESGESTYTVCTFVRELDPSQISIVAPSGSHSGSFGANAQEGDIVAAAEALFESKPLDPSAEDMSGSFHLVTGTPGSLSLVEAANLFSLDLPEGVGETLAGAEPKCSKKFCSHRDTSCLLTF